MAVDGDLAASALVESMRALVAAIPDGWARERPGVLAAVTGAAAPTLNGVWVHEVDAAFDDVANLLSEVAATGLPHCMQTRPSNALALAQLAASCGMSRVDDIPLMVVDHPDDLVIDAPGDPTVIRRLHPEEASLYAQTVAEGFEEPPEVFVQLLTPRILGMNGVRCYLGEIDGTAVTTGMGITFGSSVGIANIATPPAHRRHGYGAAVTVRAVTDGFASGATWSWLQASPAGFPIYERLGFRTVESWHCWEASPAS